jgi:hypothetical protein
MADVEQEQSYTAEHGSQKAACQAMQLAHYRGVEEAMSMPFIVKAYFEGRALTATAETTKEAFASAIEWHVVGKLTDVSISDGTRSYSLVEFSLIMALVEIAHTIRADVDANNPWKL